MTRLSQLDRFFLKFTSTLDSIGHGSHICSTPHSNEPSPFQAHWSACCCGHWQWAVPPVETMVPVELSDDRGLLGNLEHSSSQAVTPVEERPAKLRALRRADYTSSQILQPHAPSSIEKATLQGLWDVVSAGNKWTMYYSYLADSEPLRQGVALS